MKYVLYTQSKRLAVLGVSGEPSSKNASSSRGTSGKCLCITAAVSLALCIVDDIIRHTGGLSGISFRASATLSA